MKDSTLAVVFLLLLPAIGGTDDGNVVFQRISADQTGIATIFRNWRADELERQGGEWQSHGWWPWGLTAFDIDRDGDMDLLATHHGKPRGMVLKSLLIESGKLSFTNATNEMGVDNRDLPGADGKPWIWDFNGDGWLDIAGWSDESKPNSLFNLGGDRLAVIPDFSFRPISHAGELLDLNGDGYLDLRAIQRGTLYECEYDPDSRRFQVNNKGEAPTGRVPEHLSLFFAEFRQDRKNRWAYPKYSFDHDLNADGRKDLVAGVAGAYGGVKLGRYYLADGQGEYSDRTEEMGLPKEGAPTLVLDVTGDGSPEVLVGMTPSGGLYVNDGKGRFAVQEGGLSDFLRKSDPYALRAWPADFDDDGDMDLVVSGPRYGREAVYENQGGGRFHQVLQARGWDSDPVVICDINGDGRLDLAIGEKTDDKVGEITCYINASKNPGNFVNLHLRMDSPNPYAVGTIVEIWRAGVESAAPHLVEKAHPDATPIHVGIGHATHLDMRVMFPGKPALELTNVPAEANLTIRPDGLVE